MVKTDAKWLELKEKAPKLAFSILEEFADHFENWNAIIFQSIEQELINRFASKLGYPKFVARRPTFASDGTFFAVSRDGRKESLKITCIYVLDSPINQMVY
jgi:hypothetical protein